MGMTEEQKKKTKEATDMMADMAMKLGADCNDTNGMVRKVVTALGFGFEAWLCVCIEIADREARAEGFKDASDRAITRALQKKGERDEKSGDVC